jgi:hypothetical protein
MCVQAVSSAQKALGTALAGVVLLPEEQEQLSSRLQKAAAKKVADLLQVGTIPVPLPISPCSRLGVQKQNLVEAPAVCHLPGSTPAAAHMGAKLYGMVLQIGACALAWLHC